MTDTAQPLPQVLTSAEVAARFRRSVRWFRHARRQLQAQGFPAPLPGCARPPLWSTAAVDRWLRGEPPTADEEHDPLRAELRERARRIARFGGKIRRHSGGGCSLAARRIGLEPLSSYPGKPQ